MRYHNFHTTRCIWILGWNLAQKWIKLTGVLGYKAQLQQCHSHWIKHDGHMHQTQRKVPLCCNIGKCKHSMSLLFAKNWTNQNSVHWHFLKKSSAADNNEPTQFSTTCLTNDLKLKSRLLSLFFIWYLMSACILFCEDRWGPDEKWS